MKLIFTKSFTDKFVRQLQYISLDKPLAAKKFRSNVIKEIRKIPDFPFKHRKSIFFEDDSIRDLVFKGYIIVYRIKTIEIEIFGFIKYEEFLN